VKAKRNLLVGLILGALIGWALGFLRLPYIEKNFSFLLGFIACLALVSLGLILLFVWKKNSLLIRLIGKDSTTQDSNNATWTYTFIWILISVFIVLGGLASSLLIVNQNELGRAQTQQRNQRIAQQSELIEAVRKSSSALLIGNVIDKVDIELRNNPKGTLSDETIAKIAALNYSFEPYRYLEGDSFSDKKLSPERGRLLLALSLMNIDSSSFEKIKFDVSFSGADLGGADLHGADLNGVDLKGADLKDADLRGADFSGADLSGANLSGANLNMANLRGADMKRADLRGAELNQADLKLADLNGADLSSAKFRKSDLRGATIKWAELEGTMLNEANLARVDLFGAGLKKANLTNADLTEVRLRKTDFSEAILLGVTLTHAEIDEDWLEKLDEWRTIGAKGIQESYKVVDIDLPIYEWSQFRLERIED